MEEEKQQNSWQILCGFKNTQVEVDRLFLEFEHFDQSKFVDDEVVSRIIENMARLKQVWEEPEMSEPPEFMNVARWKVSYLDKKLLMEFISNPSDNRLAVLVVDHLEILLSALNLKSGLQIYNYNELDESFRGLRPEEEKNRFYYTLGQLSGMDKIFDYKPIVLSFLDVYRVRFDGERMRDWENSFGGALLVQAVWSWFMKLEDEDRTFLCQNYIYLAIVFGVPIRKHLSYYLYKSFDAVDYILKNQSLFASLEGNTEKVMVDLEKGLQKPLVDLLKGFLSHYSGAEGGGGFKSQSLIYGTYSSQHNSEKFSIWLHEAFLIYFLLSKAELIDHIYKEEETETSEYEKDFTHLLLHYVTGEFIWKDIVKYYQQENPRVPLRAFLQEIMDHEDANEEEKLNKFLSLCQLLRKEGVWKNDVDVVHFDEKTGKFEWNKELPI